MSIETAPSHLKLAIDIIQILEENEIDNDCALKALEIVISDIKYKQKHLTPPSSCEKLDDKSNNPKQ